jgi:hypothetical protein
VQSYKFKTLRQKKFTEKEQNKSRRFFVPNSKSSHAEQKKIILVAIFFILGDNIKYDSDIFIIPVENKLFQPSVGTFYVKREKILSRAWGNIFRSIASKLGNNVYLSFNEKSLNHPIIGTMHIRCASPPISLAPS